MVELNPKEGPLEMRLMELVRKTQIEKNMSKQEKKNLGNKPKRQKITIGSIVEISIEGLYYVYAQILPKSLYAFFEYRSKEPIVDLSCLTTAPVLFVIPVYDYVITKGIWLKVGKLSIRKDLEILPLEYIYDNTSDKYSTYNCYTGKIVPSTKEDVRGLERAAVWAENHVEDRIRDYYNQVPCLWLKEHYELFPESLPKKISMGANS